MPVTLFLLGLAILVLLLMSAFFSGSETALTATSRAKLLKLAQDGEQRALPVASLIKNRERLIGAILLGNNLVNILASALATALLLGIFGDAGVVYATLVMTMMVLIFAEVMPKTFALSNPERLAIWVGPAIRLFVSLFAPIVAAVQWIVRRTLRAVGVDLDDVGNVLSPREEIRGTINLHHKEGGVVKHDLNMLGGILDLKDLTVDEVMVHRKNMQMIDSQAAGADIIEEVLSSPYTRLPFWKDNAENIVGVLHAKDLLRAMKATSGDISNINFDDLLTKPWFVPETTTLREQLNAFLRERKHFALVVDEYGALMGLITLEDILEEIVGDISDEHDILARGVRPQPNGSVYVDGTVTIRDLNRAMDWTLPDEEANTVAGLVIHEAQTIPVPGQIFSYYSYRFEILRRHRNQITALQISPPTH